jgi:hypothetical protein
MHGSVVHRAKRDQIILLVPTSLGEELDVMQIQKLHIPAARDDATPLIAKSNCASRRGRNALPRARAHVGAAPARARRTLVAGADAGATCPA